MLLGMRTYGELLGSLVSQQCLAVPMHRLSVIMTIPHGHPPDDRVHVIRDGSATSRRLGLHVMAFKCSSVQSKIVDTRRRRMKSQNSAPDPDGCSNGTARESQVGTKTGRDRSAPLARSTVAALRRQAQQHAADAAERREAWTDAGDVFTRADGRPRRPDRITKLFSAAVKASGLPLIRLHDLRHSYATLALSAGVHPKAVQKAARPCDHRHDHGHLLARHPGSPRKRR